MHLLLKLNIHSLLATLLDSLWNLQHRYTMMKTSNVIFLTHHDSLVYSSPIKSNVIPIGLVPVSYQLLYSWWVIDDCWVFVTFMREEREAASGALLLELFFKLLPTKKTPISHLIITTAQNIKQNFGRNLHAKYTQFSDRHLTWDLHFNCAS